MSLVEAEEPAAVDGVETPIVTAPPPLHRRVSVSLLFTLAILVGTVVTIYLVFPARQNVLLTEALAQHRSSSTTWELATPSVGEMRAWTRGLVGADAPVELLPTRIVGTRRTTLLDRPVAILRFDIADATVTALVQHARGLTPPEDRTSGDLRAITFRKGKYATVVVGPAATADRWSLPFR